MRSLCLLGVIQPLRLSEDTRIGTRPGGSPNTVPTITSLRDHTRSQAKLIGASPQPCSNNLCILHVPLHFDCSTGTMSHHCQQQQSWDAVGKFEQGWTQLGTKRHSKGQLDQGVVYVKAVMGSMSGECTTGMPGKHAACAHQWILVTCLMHILTGPKPIGQLLQRPMATNSGSEIEAVNNIPENYVSRHACTDLHWTTNHVDPMFPLETN